MSSSIGKNIKLTIFGQSHSTAIGMVLEGVPAGLTIDMEAVAAFMQRRAPGRDAWSTPRREPDIPEVLSGLVGNTTCGAPICAIIRNSNHDSSAYESIKEVFRPGHADFTAHMKYHGFQDVSGGGHFSGRLTAPLVFAGAICLQALALQGIFVGAHIRRIGAIEDVAFDAVNLDRQQLMAAGAKRFPVISDQAGEEMARHIAWARSQQDSVGGIIECGAVGIPVGIGSPMFDGLENTLARIIFGIPAVKGIEFGAGFNVAEMLGSENNDPFALVNDRISPVSNNAGGILGGISTGAPLVFRVAIKPTPSISQSQQSVTVDGRLASCATHGRHDPCIVPRAVPVVEAACALALYDLLLDSRLDQR